MKGARQDEGRRQQILAISTQLFSQNGYHETKLDDVAAVIGFSKPAIYHYFHSKQDILFHIRYEIVRRALDNLQALLAGPGSPSEKLVAALEAQVRTAVTNLGAWAVFHQTRGLLSEDRERDVRNIEREYERHLRSLYQEAIEAGEVVPEDPRIAIDTMLGACNYVYRWYRDDPVDAFARRVVGLLAGGMLTPAARMPARLNL